MIQHQNPAGPIRVINTASTVITCSAMQGPTAFAQAHRGKAEACGQHPRFVAFDAEVLPLDNLDVCFNIWLPSNLKKLKSTNAASRRHHAYR